MNGRGLLSRPLTERQRGMKLGSPAREPKGATGRICTISGCGLKFQQRSFCRMLHLTSKRCSAQGTCRKAEGCQGQSSQTVRLMKLLKEKVMVSTKTKGLEDLFVDGLKDIYYAEKKITKALPKMSSGAEKRRSGRCLRQNTSLKLRPRSCAWNRFLNCSVSPLKARNALQLMAF